MEYTNYQRGSCLFDDVCDMSFSKDGKVICLTSSDGNIDGKIIRSLCEINENIVRKCEDNWPILMRLTPDEYNHKPVLATIFTPNVYDNSVPEGRIILARQAMIQTLFQVFLLLSRSIYLVIRRKRKFQMTQVDPKL